MRRRSSPDALDNKNFDGALDCSAYHNTAQFTVISCDLGIRSPSLRGTDDFLHFAQTIFDGYVHLSARESFNCQALPRFDRFFGRSGAV